MPIHRPKLISSIEGLGLNTTKSMRYISKTIAIGTEVWNELQEPWQEGDTIIALPAYKWVTRWEAGKPYIINKFYDDANHLVGIYCDVARPVRQIEGGFEFDDLYLDVWWATGKPISVLDEDELQEALGAGYITTNEAVEAHRVAKELIELLKQQSEILQF